MRPANVGSYQFFCVLGLSVFPVDKASPATSFSDFFAFLALKRSTVYIVTDFCRIGKEWFVVADDSCDGEIVAERGARAGDCGSRVGGSRVVAVDEGAAQKARKRKGTKAFFFGGAEVPPFRKRMVPIPDQIRFCYLGITQGLKPTENRDFMSELKLRPPKKRRLRE